MKLQDLVKIMEPALVLVIKAKGSKPTDEYLFDGTVAELTPDWFDKLVVAINRSPYDNGVEAVVA